MYDVSKLDKVLWEMQILSHTCSELLIKFGESIDEKLFIANVNRTARSENVISVQTIDAYSGILQYYNEIATKYALLQIYDLAVNQEYMALALNFETLGRVLTILKKNKEFKMIRAFYLTKEENM